MAKTKAMCIINRSCELIGIQHEKRGKGSKNSSSHFDDRIDVEDLFLTSYILFCYMYIIYFS